MILDPMIQLFSMKQLGYPAQIGFDGEALIPGPAFAVFNVLRGSVLLTQAQVSQRDRLTIVSGGQRTKHVIRLVGRVPGPINHLTHMVDQPGQLDADNPAPVRFAFLANLALASAFASRMDQLDAIGVQHRKEGRVAEERQHIFGVVAKQALEPRAFGQLGKEATVIGVQPAIKGAKPATFQAKEQSDRDNLTGVQMSVGTLVDVTKLVVYYAKQADDDLVRGHTVLL